MSREWRTSSFSDRENCVDAEAEWRTSSYSGGASCVEWKRSARCDVNGSCVETATAPAGRVLVRDSKDKAGPVLEFTPAMWQALTGYLKSP